MNLGISSKLIYEPDDQERLHEWISKRTKNEYPLSVCIGLERNGEIIGCVAYQNFEQCMCAHIAIDQPISKFYLKAIFDYPFNQAKKKKIIALIENTNKKSIKFVEKLGFRLMAHDKIMIYQITLPEWQRSKYYGN